MSHGDLVVWNDKVGIIINRENTCQIYIPKEKKYYVPSKEDKIIRVISDKTVIGDYLCMYEVLEEIKKLLLNYGIC